jgi:hypothetical protein
MKSLPEGCPTASFVIVCIFLKSLPLFFFAFAVFNKVKNGPFSHT